MVKNPLSVANYTITQPDLQTYPNHDVCVNYGHTLSVLFCLGRVVGKIRNVVNLCRSRKINDTLIKWKRNF